MNKTRLEACSDAVIAIIMTIMVLELKVPHDPTWEALRPPLPTLMTYVLSFVFLGIYWSNHHHLMQAARHVTEPILWANLHLLLWLSLVPFGTARMGEHFGVAPDGVILLMCGIVYWVLVKVLVPDHEAGSLVTKASGRDWKGGLGRALCAGGGARAGQPLDQLRDLCDRFAPLVRAGLQDRAGSRPLRALGRKSGHTQRPPVKLVCGLQPGQLCICVSGADGLGGRGF